MIFPYGRLNVEQKKASNKYIFIIPSYFNNKRRDLSIIQLLSQCHDIGILTHGITFKF